MLAVLAMLAIAVPMLRARGGDRGSHDVEEGGSDGRVRHGLAISPVPVRLDNGHDELVALGSYLVNAAAARSDFTRTELRTGRDPYLGQSAKINAEHFLAGGRQVGPFTSRNLTPEAPLGRPARLTHAVRAGHASRLRLRSCAPAIRPVAAGHAVAGVCEHDGARSPRHRTST